MCHSHTTEYLVLAKESNITCCYFQGWKVVSVPRNKRLHFRTCLCRKPEETQSSPSWQDVPIPISYIHFYVLSHSHLDPPVLNHCALPLYSYQLPQEDQNFHILSYPSDFNPLVLGKWGLPLWTSPLLPTLRYFHYVLFYSVINSKVFYVPSPSCSNWNLRCSWNPNFHVAFLADGYLSPTLIGTEDEVENFWLFIDTSRSFFSLLLQDSQIWVSDYESILATISSCGSHLTRSGDTS